MKFIPRSLKPKYPIGSLDNKPSKNEFRLMAKREFTCACCGFKSKPTKSIPSGGMEFMVYQGSAYLLCLMCIQSQYIDRPIVQEGILNHGRLAYCPTLSQGQVVNLYRDLFCLKLFAEKTGD